MARIPSELITRIIAAGAMLIVSALAYFLTDRDATIRSRIEALEKQAIQNQLQLERNIGRLDTQGREIDGLRQGIQSRGERISRLEALIERCSK